MSDAKPMTTMDVNNLHVAAEYEGESTLLVDRDDLLATIRALEKAVAELDAARATVSELVKALQSIATGHEGEDEDFGASVYEIARDALAKAKGGKS